MIKVISFTKLSIFTFLIQYQQPSGCQCCQSCRCCNQNNTSSYYKEKHGVDDRDIYYYLKRDFPNQGMKLTQEDINKIAENYLKIINEANDAAKTLDEVTTDILTSEIIIQHLGINKAINEIDNINDVRGKIIKINWIVNDDFINKKYTYENSNLKLPRCLVKHEDNNCALESYLTAMLSNPYIIKFFYLLNYLFENGLLLEENYPVTFEVCKFFNEAVNHPNFTDTIRCISVMKAYFDNYPNNRYAQIKDKNGNLMYTYGSFQNCTFAGEIRMCVVNELNTVNHLKIDQDNSIVGKYSSSGFFDVGHCDKDIECHICCQYSEKKIPLIDMIKALNRLEYSGYTYKGSFIHSTSILFYAVNCHFYTFRKINNMWINYDSCIKTPTPVSDKFISRLILNSILQIHNFNGQYPLCVTKVAHHYDLVEGDPTGYLNYTNENISADVCYTDLHEEDIYSD